MSLQDVFQNVAVIAFNVFSSLVRKGRYIVTPTESGWGDADTPSTYEMDVIENGLSQDQKANTKFYSQIQPTDNIIMVKGVDIIGNGIEVKNADEFEIDSRFGTKKFVIIDHETDPAEALFTILLRENHG